MWDPEQYARYRDERSRPFFELVARVGAASPRRVADLGCGPGHLTVALARRWPRAEVVGVDDSAQMLEAARAMLAGLPDDGSPPGQGRAGSGTAPPPEDRDEPGGGTGSISFRFGDVHEFAADPWPDVIVSNAVLQWIPGHRDLLSRWADRLSPGGWLAVQVPGNYDQPSHQILRDLAASPRWRASLSGVAVTRQTDHPADYLEVLSAAGCEVDAWETTYLHVLHGEDAVLDFYKGSALRPVAAALGAGADEFVSEYAALLRAAYPARSYGTLLPFRRVFAVAHKTAGGAPS